MAIEMEILPINEYFGTVFLWLTLLLCQQLYPFAHTNKQKIFKISIDWQKFQKQRERFIVILHIRAYQKLLLVSLYRVQTGTFIAFIVINAITYIIGYYNPSVWIIDLVSQTAYVVCVNFIHKFRDLQFEVDSERKIFFKTLCMAIFLYSQSFCQKSGERKSPEKYFSYFVLMSGLGLEPWLFV